MIHAVLSVDGDLLFSAYRKMYGEASPGELLVDILAGKAQLWVAMEGQTRLGVVATAITRTPEGNHLQIRALGGQNLERWVHLIRVIENWAKGLGCNRVMTLARRGIAAMLKQSHNYHSSHELVTKTL